MTLGWRRRAWRALAGSLAVLALTTWAAAQDPEAPPRDPAPPASPALRLAALTEDGRLLLFSTANPEQVTARTLEGPGDPFCGIDYRPADRRLYGVTTASEIYTIDPETGATELVSTLTRPFDGETRSGVDFTPLADRLRLVSHDGQDLRINVDVGATAIDGPLVYTTGDPNHGERPEIAAVAYTKNLPGTAATEMYDIDSGLDILVRQEPPNDGILHTIGPLGVDFPVKAGFEIVSEPSGAETAFAAFRDELYRIDLQTGRATRAGRVGGSPGEIVGLSWVGPPAGRTP
jgi:trimeric autotransporter adhesin